MINNEHRKIKHRILAFVLIFAFILGDAFCGIGPLAPLEVKAMGGKLTLSQAYSLAVSNSDDYENVELELATKQAEYSSAVKAIEIKRKQNSTIKWSFLLSFDFPITPSESEEYDYIYKPLEISQQITKLRHKKNDVTNTIKEEIYQTFVEIYTLQEKIAFNKSQLKIKKNSYIKLKAKLVVGKVEQGTIDALKESIEGLQDTIAEDQSSLETKKERLSEKIDLDVTTKYSFQDPYTDHAIPRSKLNDFIESAYEYDETYYEKRMDATTSRISLQTHWKLIAGHYNSSDVDIIRSYVTTILADGDVSKKAFKKDYNVFIKKIDSYWQGRKKIFWFISIPRIWLKDEEEDGQNWISDDPQALYSDAMDYVQKRKDRDAYKKELKNSVKDCFNNYISAKKAYNSAKSALADAIESQNKAGVLYKMGSMKFDEYSTFVDGYATAYDAKVSALSDYSSAIYSLNKVTYGAALNYLMSLNSTSSNMDGSPYIDQTIETAYYYFEPIVEDAAFEFHVYVPDKFTIEGPTIVYKNGRWRYSTKAYKPNYYELWIGTTRIGSKSKLDQSIKHLEVDRGDDNQKAYVRFYYNNILLANCYFDMGVDRGKLDVVVEEELVGEIVKIGSYRQFTSKSSGIVTINISPDKSIAKKVKKYRICYTTGEFLQGDDYIKIDKSFKYLGILQKSISDIRIEFYDEDGNIVAKGMFNPADMTIIKDTTGE